MKTGEGTPFSILIAQRFHIRLTEGNIIKLIHAFTIAVSIVGLSYASGYAISSEDQAGSGSGMGKQGLR
jgi:hypothetical protein